MQGLEHTVREEERGMWGQAGLCGQSCMMGTTQHGPTREGWGEGRAQEGFTPGRELGSERGQK